MVIFLIYILAVPTSEYRVRLAFLFNTIDGLSAVGIILGFLSIGVILLLVTRSFSKDACKGAATSSIFLLMLLYALSQPRILPDLNHTLVRLAMATFVAIAGVVGIVYQAITYHRGSQRNQ